MGNENAENVETVENEPSALDTLESAVNALVDETTAGEDNNNSAANSAEEALKGMSDRLDLLESENKRLTDLIGKMVTAYGARLNDSGGEGVEAFPSSIEQKFDNPSNSNVVGLSDIVLGS